MACMDSFRQSSPKSRHRIELNPFAACGPTSAVQHAQIFIAFSRIIDAFCMNEMHTRREWPLPPDFVIDLV